MSSIDGRTRMTTPSTSSPLFRERLTPGIGTWIVLLGFGLTLGVVMLPLSAWVAALVGVLAMGAMVAVGIFTSPLIIVDGRTLRAGRAHISVEHLGEVTVFDRSGWSRAMGVGFVPSDYHCTRGWISTGLRVLVTDPEDPTPGWLLSTRRPEDLALALEAARRA